MNSTSPDEPSTRPEALPADPVHPDQINADSVHAGPVNVDHLRDSPANVDSVHAGPVNVDHVRDSPVNVDSVHVGPVDVDRLGVSPINVDPVRAGRANGDHLRDSPVNADSADVSPVDVDRLRGIPVNVDRIAGDSIRASSVNIEPVNIEPVKVDGGMRGPADGRGAASPSRRVRASRLIGWPLLLVAAVAFPAVAGAYPVGIAAYALVLGLLAMSAQLLVAVAGLPAFGQPAYFGIGAYIAALLSRAGHQEAPLLLIVAASAGGVAAAITAPMLLRTRGTAFLMATFAVQSLTATAAIRWTTVTGGDEGLHTPPALPWPGGTPLTAPAYVYWYALAVVVLSYIGIVVFLRSRLALTLRGIAGHEPRMTALGHRVTGALTAGYTIAGLLAGLAGGLLVVVNRYVSPADLGFEAAALTLLAAAIGAGTILGAAGGAALVVAVRDGAGIGTGGLSPLLLGLLFLAVAYLRPLTARGFQPFAARRVR